MGLDALVYCNCIENGRLHTPHPFPEILFFEPDGLPCIKSDDSQKQMEHDEWLSRSPCKHQECIVLERHIGNLAFVGWVRESIKMFSSEPANEYPIIWNKVVYSGSHCGDFLTIEDVRSLDSELTHLSQYNLNWSIPLWLKYLPSILYWKFIPKKELQKSVLCEFLKTMRELTNASLAVNKSISF